jgi:alkylation response protein AidB-like acyl-CoA dehydrogenase
MEFRHAPEDEAFRGEVRAWLHENLPSGWKGSAGLESEDWETSRAFIKKLAARGWIAPAWPKEYGGAGMSLMQQSIFREEFAYNRAPNGIHIIAVGFVGPTIMVYGTDDQKARHLPGITRGDTFWCQGFSEPGSGSDLASLQTRAVRDGDDFVINGQKIWTSFAHHAEWMILLARTDPEAPKHRGISYFLLDMKTPGITIRPLINMADRHGFNEVFFDNVRIPKDNLVGELNRGWYVATTTLDFERSAVSGVADARRQMDDLLAAVKARGDGRRHRAMLTDLCIEIEVAQELSYRVLSLQIQGKVPNYEASVAKVFTSELEQRIAAAAVASLGMAGQLMPGDTRAPIGGDPALSYLESVSATIAGGTSNIQRNIIATRGLGLPRG